MQDTLIDLLSLDHVLVGVEAADAQAVIRILADLLVQSGHVTPRFVESILKREQTYPTGLPTEPFATAIPHADPDQVNASSISVGVLKSAVQFAQMGTDGSVRLDVLVVFLLAIKERDKQVGLIQQLTMLIQNPSLLQALSEAKTPVEVLDMVHKALQS
jgi:PTS system galactitol-specific IIA component